MPIIAGRASAAYGAGFAAITAAPYAGPFGAYDALASITVQSGGLSSIQFSAIPTGYKHLQIRALAQQASTGGTVELTFNDATFVRRHYMYGQGSSSAISGSDTQNAPAIFTGAFATSSLGFAASIVDILDYNSTKNKTTRSLGGIDNNGSGSIYFMSGLYTSTSPITSITITAVTQNFTQYSSFALYGVK